MSGTRADRVQAQLAGEEIDALLVTDQVNIRYLSGFTGSNALLVVGEGIRRFVTDFRYTEQAASEVDGFERERGPQDLIAALADGWPAGPLRLGFDAATTTVRDHDRIARRLPAAVELVAVEGLVAGVRAVKEPEEIDAIRAACALADEALSATLEEGLIGRTERAVAAALEGRIRTAGGEPSFATIIASGSHGALPHAAPRDVEIARGTLVTIDWGARLDGYCSDCTRTVAAGPLERELIDLHALVLDAQVAAVLAVRPGVEGRALDAVARERITAAGHGDHFGHGLGHGVGLLVHEAPRLSPSSEDTLAPGNAVTVEPGIYIPGLGGVRIEDLLALSGDGATVLTTGVEKGLVTVG